MKSNIAYRELLDSAPFANTQPKTGYCINTDAEKTNSFQNLFMLLSLIFSYPDDQIYQEILSTQYTTRELFQIYNRSAPDLLRQEELQAEYISLFVNNYTGIPLIPYASWHLDPDGRITGNTLDRIQNIILEQGYQIKDSNSEPEDHISIVLELCSRILQFTAFSESAPEKKTKANQDFSWLVETCLGPMLQDMQEKIANLACSDFYPLFILLSRDFISDVQALSDLTCTEKNIAGN